MTGQEYGSGASRRQTDAAAVWNFCQGFLQDEALLGSRRKNSPPPAPFNNRRIVKVGVKSEQRQLKTILSTLLAVAWPRAATGRRHRRDHQGHDRCPWSGAHSSDRPGCPRRPVHPFPCDVPHGPSLASGRQDERLGARVVLVTTCCPEPSGGGGYGAGRRCDGCMVVRT